MDHKYTNLGVNLFVIVLLVVFAFILIFTPNNSRELMIGEESYYHARIAEDPFRDVDELSYSGREHMFNAWPLLLNASSSMFNLSIETSSIILPLLFALGSLVLFYLLLRRLKVSFRIRSLASLILAFSPGFIYSGTVSTDFVVPIFLLLAAFLLFLYRKNFLAYLFVLAVPFFGTFHALISFFFILILGLKYNLKRFYLMLIIISFLVLWPFLLNGLPSIAFIGNSFLKGFVSDFGGFFGLSIFVIFLSFFGISKLWEKKYKNFPIYFSLIFLVIFVFFNAKTLLYLVFLASFLAALGFIKIVESKWKSSLIKSLSLIIISFGVIFSLTSSMEVLPNEFPDEDTREALMFIKEDSNPGDIILSHHSRGHWITYFSERKNFMDTQFFFAPALNERQKDFNELINTKDLNKAILLTKKYSVDYIYIDPWMRSNLWQKEEEGLQFLLEFSKNFKKIYNQNGYEVYKVE